MIPDDLNISLEDSLTKSPELAAEYQNNPIAKQIVDTGRVIEGMVKTPVPMLRELLLRTVHSANWFPLTTQDGILTTQYPKDPESRWDF